MLSPGPANAYSQVKPRLLLSLILPLLFCACDDTATESGISFTGDVKPLLEARCLVCHNTGTLLGHLNLETRELAFAPGPEGPFIVPGDPLASRLYTFTLKKEPDPQAMPPDRHRLTASEKKLLHDWITQGAAWPRGPEGRLHVLAEPAS